MFGWHSQDHGNLQWRKVIDGGAKCLEILTQADSRKWAQHMEMHEVTEIPKMRLKPGKTMGIGFYERVE